MTRYYKVLSMKLLQKLRNNYNYYKEQMRYNSEQPQTFYEWCKVWYPLDRRC
jgi:hypothetical protein